ASGDLNLLTGLEFETVKMRKLRILKRERGNEAAAKESVEQGKKQARAEMANAFKLLGEPQRTSFSPNRPHAYFSGVRTGLALSDYPQQEAWTVKVPYEGFALSLAHDTKQGEGVMWTRPLGQ